MSDENADHRADDHAEQHERCHIITRLHEKPHRHDGCQKQIRHDNVDPGGFGGADRKCHTHCKHGNEQRDCNDRFYHFIHLADMLLDQTEDNGDDDKEHGDGSSGGVCVGGLGSHAVHAFSDERTGNHVRERCNDKQGKQPAEQHEELPSGLADIFFNNHTHRLALIFDRGIQRTEILYRAEKQTTDDQPQEYRHPAEYGG